MKNRLTVVILISSMILGASILSYGYMNYHYKMVVLDREAEDSLTKKINLQNCKEEAERYHNNWWNNSCENFGSNKKNSTCSLPTYIADDINSKRDKDIDNCVKLYSADK